jgi:hypothetical protein
LYNFTYKQTGTLGASMARCTLMVPESFKETVQTQILGKESDAFIA